MRKTKGLQMLLLMGLTIATAAVSVVQGKRLVEQEKEYQIREAAIQTGISDLTELQQQQQQQQQKLEELQQNQSLQQEQEEQQQKNKETVQKKLQQLEVQTQSLQQEVSEQEEKNMQIQLLLNEVKEQLGEN